MARRRGHGKIGNFFKNVVFKPFKAVTNKVNSWKSSIKKATPKSIAKSAVQKAATAYVNKKPQDAMNIANVINSALAPAMEHALRPKEKPIEEEEYYDAETGEGIQSPYFTKGAVLGEEARKFHENRHKKEKLGDTSLTIPEPRRTVPISWLKGSTGYGKRKRLR